ncbi:hypothetical protein DRQ53_13005 [bacterium]|nr:MAG: hypothetical protein DRQ53_13005 [bacterium]
MDIVSVPTAASGEISILLGRTKSGGELHFDDVSGHVGLTPGGAGGVKLGDYDDDGDIDLLLGRAGDSAGQANYYFSNTGTALGNQITVALDANGSGNPELGNGARVTVTPAGGTPQVQYVDGGSGRGSQDSQFLSFGIGSAATADVEVLWPDGTVSSAVGATPGATVLVADDHAPGMVAGSLDVTVNQNGSAALWKFTWETTSAISRCEIEVESNSHRNPACQYNGQASFTVKPEETMMGHSVTYNVDTGRFEHRLNFNRDCAALCSYDYRLRIWSGANLEQTGWQSFILPICGEIQN